MYIGHTYNIGVHNIGHISNQSHDAGTSHLYVILTQRDIFESFYFSYSIEIYHNQSNSSIDERNFADKNLLKSYK